MTNCFPDKKSVKQIVKFFATKNILFLFLHFTSSIFNLSFPLRLSPIFLSYSASFPFISSHVGGSEGREMFQSWSKLEKRDMLQ